tara:strand:- start:191 stop:592 length:402 start_codon:yes stop_codon:yes gene_type:complete
MSTQLKSQEGLITAILTQSVEDAKYTGTNKIDLQHKIESINWIMSNELQFKEYCKLLNIETSYIQNKIKSDVKITSEQKIILEVMTEKETVRLKVKAESDKKKLMKKQKISAAVIPRWYNIISKTKNYNEERI